MERSARRIVVSGRVQGVGFRPFVYVTAHELGITGSVLNGSGKVFIHAEGPAKSLDRLEHALIHAAPPLARPKLASSQPVATKNTATFEILPSDSASESEIHVPPDLYTCDDCIEELGNPDERRHGYPFINCTQCGPRYTIITAMPYDRPNTSMAAFPLCDDCRKEYESPRDRRFHAQPLACPECGPELHFHAGDCSEADQANHAQSSLPQAVQALQEGKIIAVKGVGGYHLVCDAGNDEAVSRLRTRKHRPHKPLAVMFPITGADGLDTVRESLQLDDTSAQAISDPARPIVLVPKRKHSSLSQYLAPGLNELGVFLPYSPLHHQLLQAYAKPIVATSGNISGEPVITDNNEARQRLAKIADAFLDHNRPIVRPADDPVIRPIAGRARVIRLGRGIAPLELELPSRLDKPLLATGGHMKVTVALAWQDRVVISPHIGELDSPRSNDIFNKIIKDIQSLYNVNSHKIICDLHPGYSSTRWAQQQGLPLLQVQHHAAHASSLAGEHPDIEKWLVFTWDGVGYGSDGTLWGGEALAGKPGAWTRMASFRPFNLVGGDKAGREPWRSAAALMWAEDRDWLPTHAEPNPASHQANSTGGASPATGEAIFPVGASPATGQAISPVGASPVIDQADSAGGASPATGQGNSLGGASLAVDQADSPGGTSLAIDHADSPGGASLANGQDNYITGASLAREAWNQGINVFETSAAGRLFDAAAALVLNRNIASFEGQGPMELEQIAASGCEAVPLPLQKDSKGLYRSNWAPLLDVLSDQQIPAAHRAGIFHQTMAQALTDQALKIRNEHDYTAVGLSGGVFQNRLLTELVVDRLKKQGIEVRLHKEIPTNDGGLCFGQIIEALASE